MIRSRKKLGKYLIERKIGEGGFATVYRAFDTIEGGRVALKILMPQFADIETQDEFRKEVRMVAKLSHPNILGLKNAEIIDKYFVVAFPLGHKSLAQRLENRLSAKLALDFTEQILEAVAHAHEHRIIHCDIKPENLILFADNQLLLTDFGIAKVAHRTLKASGSGTVASDGLSDNMPINEIANRIRKGHLPSTLTKLVNKCRGNMLGDFENAKPDDLAIVVFRSRKNHGR